MRSDIAVGLRVRFFTILSLFAALAIMGPATRTWAATVPEPPTSIAAINADERADSPPPLPPGGYFQPFVVLPAVTENGTGGQFGTGTSLILTAPAGFEFDTASAITAASTNDINLGPATVTQTQIAFLVVGQSTTAGTITFSGMKIRPMVLSAATRIDHPVTISGVVFGNPWSATIAVARVAPGKPFRLSLSASYQQQPAPVEAPLNSVVDFTIIVRDEAGNRVDTQLIDVLAIDPTNSANPDLLVYNGPNVVMNAPPNGQAQIVGMTTTDQGEMTFQCRDNNAAEETVTFVVSDGRNIYVPSNPVAVRWYEQSFPGGQDVTVTNPGGETITTDNRADGPSPSFAVISPEPVIREGAVGQITNWVINGPPRIVIPGIRISPPPGWIFDINSQVTATVIGSTQLDPAVVTPNLITFLVTRASQAPGNLSIISFSGIAVRPNNCAAASLGDHYVTITTGEQQLPIPPQLSSAVLATVHVVPGVAATFEVQANPALTAVNSYSDLTITALDACSNRASDYVVGAPIVITPTGMASAATLAFIDLYGGGVMPPAGNGAVTIPTNAQFDDVGQYVIRVVDTAEDTVTFTASDGTIGPVDTVAQWVNPTCIYPDGIKIWVSADKMRVLVMGNDGPEGADTVSLTVRDVGEGEWIAEDTATGTQPYPASDIKVLIISNHLCPEQTDPPNANAGVPIVDGLVVTINTLGGPDVIDWTGLAVENTDDVLIGVVANAGDGNDTIIPGPGICPAPGLTGGPGFNDTLDYSFVAETVGATGGQNAAGIVFVSPRVVTGWNGRVRETIECGRLNAFETIIGTENNDTIMAPDGVNETIWGRDGDDLLYGGTGSDWILGEAGNDIIYGGAGNDDLEGGDDDDSILGEEGDDIINGGAGDDGMDIRRPPLDGGPGWDVIHGNEGDDKIYGGDGTDWVYGDDGDDILYGDDPRVIVEPIPSGIDYMNGGPGDDYMDGGPDDDDMFGDVGDDTMYGGPGDDFMDGWIGDDSMYGDTGDDMMWGGDGSDFMDGGEGNDAVDGEGGTDIIIGGSGNDHIICGDGDDGLPEAPISGGTGDDIVEGGFGSDVLTGGSGKNVVIGQAGGDTLISDGTYDVLDYYYDGGLNPIDLDLEAGTCSDTWGNKDTVSRGFAIYRGSVWGDRMKAHPSVPVIFLGGRGSDTLIGSNRADILYGEEDNDTIFGEPPVSEADPTFASNGDGDLLFGGAGNDTIWGGPGADEIYGDGDYVPQNFDENVNVPNYWPDSQMIQLWSPVGWNNDMGYWWLVIIEPQPIQAGGTLPVIYTRDSILDIRACLRDYGNQTTVKDAFALPASEYVGGPTLARPGVTPGNDTIFAGGGPDLVAGGGGDDTIWGGTNKMAKDVPYSGRDDDFNVDTGDLIYGGYVCNRPAALQANGSWLDSYRSTWPNPVTLEGYTPYLANGFPAPWEPTPTLERLPDGSLKYPIPRPGNMLPYDMEISRAGGNDEIHAGFGNDVVIGGGGSDKINGNRGDDVIYGDYFFHRDRDDTYALISGFGAAACGPDAIRGNEGTDYIFGGPGSDVIYGGDPNDPELPYSPLENSWHMLPEEGDVIQGNTGSDFIIGSDMNGLGNRSNDSLDRGVADFTIPCIGWNGNPSTCAAIDSGVSDTVDYSMVPADSPGINVDLGNNDAGDNGPFGYREYALSDDGEGGRDTIFAVENVVGTRSPDVIKGTTRSDDSQPYPDDSRYFNRRVTDAFGRTRFPTQLTHSNPPYVRNALRSNYGYDNILLGEDGNDTLIGRRGADALCGGRGNDKLWGDGQFEATAPPGAINPDDPATNGNDELWGDEGDDEIYGEWGDDIVHGGAGFDFLSGGNGVDVLAYTEQDDYLGDGLPGAVINLRQEPVDLAAWSGIAATYASYGWPLDPVKELVPPGGFPAMTLTMPDDVHYGQTIQLEMPGGTVLPAWRYVPADMANNRGLAVARVGGAYDVIVNRYVEPNTPPIDGSILNPDRFETVYGTPYHDVIYGHNSASTTLFGDSGGYMTSGGNDILVGGSGDDVIYGEAGSDVLEGRLGNDVLIGSDPPPTPPGPQKESPRDWASYNDAPAGVVVNLSETEQQDTISGGLDRLVEIQNVLGSTFADRITGNWRVNVLAGGNGDDTLIGRSDHDIVQGNRTYIMSDTLHGGPGYDEANYSYGNPNLVRAAASQWEASVSGCPAPNGTSSCGFMTDDGESGSDNTVDIEAIREADDALDISQPSRKVVSPGQSVALEFYVQGGDGHYRVTFDPTTTTRQTLDSNGRVLNTKPVAILAAPADQASPVNPFQPEVDIPDYQAVRALTGTPAANGKWKFTVYARPTVTTSFRVTVTDQNVGSPGSETTGSKPDSSLVEVMVTQELKVSVEQPEYIITAGQEVQLRGMVSGGVTPYHITWEADNGSQATTLSRTDILIPIAKPAVTTKYTLRVQDSAPDSLSQEQTAVTKVTVLPGSSGSTIPSGSGQPTGSNGSNTNTNTNTNGLNNNASANPVPNEVSGTEEADTAPVAPMCGFGVTSWVVVGNLLLLAVMKRRRW